MHSLETIIFPQIKTSLSPSISQPAHTPRPPARDGEQETLGDCRVVASDYVMRRKINISSVINVWCNTPQRTQS